MSVIKRFTSRLYIYIIWAVLSFFIWGWIFGLATDTSTFKKVSVYIDCAQIQDMDLRLTLEEQLPEGIEMIKVHSLEYVVFDEATMFLGDILVLRESYLPNYVEALQPITGHFPEEELLYYDGEAYGIPVFDPETGEGILEDFVTFLKPGQDPEPYYLFFMKGSHHLGDIAESRDDAAIRIARRLLAME